MNTPRRITILSITLASLVLGACAAGVGSGPATSDLSSDSSPSPIPSATAAPSDDEEGASVAPSVPAGWIADVIAQAAEETGANPSDITVIVAEEVTWSDGSIGCPQEGMGYTQALVPGYRAVLEVGGEELHFHASNSGDFRLCADPQPPYGGDR